MISLKSHAELSGIVNNVNILTFAEEGFAPLEIHGRRMGIERDILTAFVHRVNQSNSLGDLYPEIPISAVPRSSIRNDLEPTNLIRHLSEFTTLNSIRLKSQVLLIDFSTPSLKSHVQDAVQLVFGVENTNFSDIILIKN